MTSIGGDAVYSARLCIARAGESGSLDWWESEALSEAGTYVLGRMFPRTGERVAARLAIEAARARHMASCPKGSVHLFHLPARLEREIQPASPATTGPSPCASVRELSERLLALGIVTQADLAAKPRAGGEAVVVGEVGEADLSDLGRLGGHIRRLVAAYCLGTKGSPVLPFLRVA